MSQATFTASPLNRKGSAAAAPSTLSTQASPSWWRSLWSRREGRFADIRRLMLGQIAAVADAGRRTALSEQINAAEHPEALWALRQDLLAALTDAHGEMLARRRMTDLTFMFAGLLDRQRHLPVDLGDADEAWPAGGGARGLVRNDVHRRTDH